MTWGWVNCFLINCSFKWLTPEVWNFPDSSRVPQDVWGIFPHFKMCHKRVYKWLFLNRFISCLIKRYNRIFSSASFHTHNADRGKPALSLFISPHHFIAYSNVRRENSGCVRNVLWQLGQFIWLMEVSRWWWMVLPASSYISTAVRWKLRHK